MKTNVKRKNYYLDTEKIQRAKKILKTKTETETISMALDLVLFRKEIRESLTKAAKSGQIEKVF
jgi:hypothetical protein